MFAGDVSLVGWGGMDWGWIGGLCVFLGGGLHQDGLRVFLGGGMHQDGCVFFLAAGCTRMVCVFFLVSLFLSFLSWSFFALVIISTIMGKMKRGVRGMCAFRP